MVSLFRGRKGRSFGGVGSGVWGEESGASADSRYVNIIYKFWILHQISKYFTIYEHNYVKMSSPNNIQYVQVICIFNGLLL